FRRRSYLKKFIDGQLTENLYTSNDTEEQIDYYSILEQVNQIIAQLPERQRTIFVKSRQEGKSSKEIAVELGISSGTVDNYISESLKFIREKMHF
ncbi:MAG: sigma-70 family RNA polymerase sigma factor, partial [Bacteroidetes bacterium]|nr:sigma-70 family RNA polymerase sigma factor [Bacteroidota bacterium]